MQHAMLLDCTLRDGAYLVEKEFGDTVIKGIIDGLIQSRIDIIEIGFLQDDGFGEGKTVYKNSIDAEKFISDKTEATMFTVLADYSRYSAENLDEYTGRSFDAVRACFFKHERYDVVDYCKQIKEKGYKVFVQPVDILGYSDEEIVELLRLVSAIDPYCVSIVDTFGSMYQEDLERLFHLLNHNLPVGCKIGFHSHNNMQMSSALSQAFLRMTFGQREVVVDTTISGMGRGAGNTPTELVAQYMVTKLGYNYDIDSLLDIIDTYMPGIRSRCTWGYSTPLFVAGAYSAHVNNINYLLDKNCVDNKGIRYVLNKIGTTSRKRYDYELLERTYLEYLSAETDDENDIASLRTELLGKDILLVVPGPSSKKHIDMIQQYKLEHENLVVISVNFLPEHIQSDYVFVSNVSRYAYWKNDERFKEVKKILTSNITKQSTTDCRIISYQRLIKCGWENMENATILLLRMLDEVSIKSIGIAGFDGYEYDQSVHKNYAQPNLELNKAYDKAVMVNREIIEMLKDYYMTRTKDVSITFVTPSRFDKV